LLPDPPFTEIGGSTPQAGARVTTADDLFHGATVAVEVSPERAFRFMADGIALGRWSFGCWNTVDRGEGLYSGRSLLTDAEFFVRPIGDSSNLIVIYHVGSAPDRLTPRIMAKIVPGPLVGRSASSCLISLMAWRDASMSTERWRQLTVLHEAEILLIKTHLSR
jgi:hypothetical protein